MPLRAIINETGSCVLRGQILDERGVPVAKAAVTAMQLTVYDKSTGTIVNSLSAVDVLDANSGELTDTITITNATQANPCVLTCEDHGLMDGELVRLDSIAGMTELNSRTFRVKTNGDDLLELPGINSIEYGEYTSGGTGRIALFRIVLQDDDHSLIGAIADGKLETHVAQLLVVSGSVQIVERVEFDVRSMVKLVGSS